ncbi:M23 family metallopeptidase [Uliginosibacterium gangwonense]|uniref:M23 family metallopeptidase n=1 Tax=Uliginosibacterium gangwonense TaxID=392736 RepID=UPI000369E561|nr:M23 family metallopeptidase [Uliginosibacterium gangwonense]
MALLLLSTKSMTRSGIRAVTMRQVAVGGLVCGVCTLVLGFGVGVVVGQRFGAATPVAVSQAANPADRAEEKFTFDKLGDMAGRLVKLESDARTLVKKLTALESLEKNLDAIRASKGVTPAKSLPNGANAGGQAYPPQTCANVPAQALGTGEKLVATEKKIECLQQLIGHMESVTTDRSVALMSLPTRQPVATYRLGSTFGNRSDPFTGRLAFHSGIDFSTATGTPIHAAGGGKVAFAGFVSELGNVLEIDHGNGLLSRYAHTSRILVTQGDVVIPGQLIAEVGSTGRSTGPHLHFEILKDGMFVDPMQYLNLDTQVAGAS